MQDSLLNLTDWKFKKIAFYKKKSISISPNLRFQSKQTNTIYRIQIGIFEEEIELDNVKGVTVVPTQDGKYIYLSETFENYNQAKVGLMQMAELGYKEAFIVKF